MSASVTVLISDGGEIARKEMRSLLDTQPDIQVTGETGSGNEAIIAIIDHVPNAVLMDMRMPVMNGLEATRNIKANSAGKGCHSHHVP